MRIEDSPTFAKQVFAGSPQLTTLLAEVPVVRRALFETGVPEKFFGYLADPELSVFMRDDGTPFVRFATSGRVHAIGVDIRSGNVVAVLEPVRKAAILVNTTLDLFGDTVRALIERFPYYQKNAGWPEIDLVCDELREIIRSIDAAAAISGCYWPAFVDDVQMGDFTIEDAREWYRRKGVSD